MYKNTYLILEDLEEVSNEYDSLTVTSFENNEMIRLKIRIQGLFNVLLLLLFILTTKNSIFWKFANEIKRSNNILFINVLRVKKG